ncbi:MAG: amidohydrolase family protein [Solibacillus sp.]
MAMRIDFHTHIYPEDLPDLAKKYGNDRWPVLENKCSCGADIMVSGKVFRAVDAQVWEAKKRIEDMDRERVDMQVLSPVPVTFSYWAPVEQALELAVYQNDFIAQTVQQYPNRFIGLGTVPLQDAEVSVQELIRCKEIGLVGIEIGTNINGQNLDSDYLLPFFKAAEQYDMPLFVHPWETMAKDRTPQHNFMYTVGMPSETALAAASLLWSGVMEKCPNLKVCFAHGGGSFPYILPRLDQGWKVWPDIRKTEHPPSYYTKNFYFDSLVYEPQNLQYLIDRFGVDKVIMGSDYPFLLREIDPGKVVDEYGGLSDEDRTAILGENVLSFLNIERSKIYGKSVENA